MHYKRSLYCRCLNNVGLSPVAPALCKLLQCCWPPLAAAAAAATDSKVCRVCPSLYSPVRWLCGAACVAILRVNDVYHLTQESVVDSGSIVLTSDAARTTRRASQTIPRNVCCVSRCQQSHDSHRSMTS